MSVYMQAYMKLPWTGTDITSGSGFDVISRQFKSSTLELFQPVKVNISPKISVSSHGLETAEDVAHKIKDEDNATVPVKGAKIEASESFLREVEVSKHSMYNVFRANPSEIQRSPSRCDTQSFDTELPRRYI
ncbi:hypothetical protein Moror_13772 [Moniliophthora roreri MCA 2997]|uniref:Uncharacterized protein n=2 Tax=Moniliophthora roreri TaxID=221103 RepID=V2WU12_MONRO|nr:hypothetical protein Moror_13772 [Moniliophthora roreri MCA 2997]